MPLKDVDSAERTQRLALWLWGGVPGAFMGGLLGILLAATRGYPEWIFLLTALAGGILVPLVAQTVSRAGGGLVGHALLPSGRSTPGRGEYSYAASLAARGRYEDAIAAFENGAQEHPTDSTPLVAAARIAARKLKKPDEAVALFRQARERVMKDPARAWAITRELTEVLAAEGGDPRRALPELARMADLLDGTPFGEEAVRELAALKAEFLPEGEKR
ncbi:MAG: tetratricopeptide repeat protein [Gemmatimonadota bacterium]